MRKTILFSILALALFVSACDTTEDSLDESEVFVGNWTIVAISDAQGDKTAIFSQGVDAVEGTFTADGDFTLSVDYAEVTQRPTVTFDGTYTVNEGTNQVTLNTSTPTGTPLAPTFGYEIESEDRIALTIADAVIEAMFGTAADTYEGQVTLTIARD